MKTAIKKSKADIAYEKLLAKAEEKGFVVDGAVGDTESWSCALFPVGTPANTKYAIVDYADWDEDGMQIQWFDLTDRENVIEEEELGYRKTPAGVLSVVAKKFN